MTIERRHLLAAPLALPFAARAASYPERPIRLIVPFPPAGGTDVISREVAGRVQARAGWNIVIENRPGAGGNIGLDVVAKATADGYTIGMGQAANLAINPALYPSMPFNPLTDFAFISTVAQQALVLVTARAAPYADVAQVIAAARRRRGEMTAGHTGNGTVGHLAGELFARAAGVELVQVPYRGAGPVTTDLLARRVDLFFANPLAVRGLIETGELRPLAVTSRARTRAFPTVPTLVEAGFAGFEAVNWTGLVAPRATPEAVIAAWNAETRRALQSDEMLARLAQDGSEPLGSTPAEFRAHVEAEHAKWGRVVREARIELS
jgi:tripartite-type tricarboxylate transporter receptor subunit TctC